MNLDDLLAPVTPEHPCGENLEYDSGFQAMEQAAQGKAEQQFGDTIIPAEPADWAEVEKLAVNLLERTKDLRVMLALTHAWTRQRGLVGYADGLLLVQQALILYWDTMYPQLNESGETDPFYRINALAALSDKSELTMVLRSATLLCSNGDELTLRDALALLDGSKTECVDYPGGRSRLIEELACGKHPGIETLRTIRERLQTISEHLEQYLGESDVLEMSQLKKSLMLLTGSAHIPAIPPSFAPAEVRIVDVQDTPPVNLEVSLQNVDWHNAQITTRTDMQLMLEKTRQYFVRHEPGHPAPLLIERIQRLIELDFMGIMQDLTPEGVQQLENIFGRHN